MHEPKRLMCTRLMANPSALDGAEIPEGYLAFRTAADELWLTPPVEDVTAVTAADPHAIVINDSSLCGVWLSADEAQAYLRHHCEWEVGAERPLFVQGAIAGLATKLWLEEERVLIIVPTPYAAELEERLSH